MVRFFVFHNLFAFLGLLYTGNPALACTHNILISEGKPGVHNIVITKNVKSDIDTVWQTLTDYPSLSHFVRRMKRSSLITRNKSKKLVEQIGVIRFLLFKREFKVLLVVEEKYPLAIEMTQIEGDFEYFQSKYHIDKKSNDSVRLTWRGQLHPSFFVPPIIGRKMIETNIKNQFCDVVLEILARTQNEEK